MKIYNKKMNNLHILLKKYFFSIYLKNSVYLLLVIYIGYLLSQNGMPVSYFEDLNISRYHSKNISGDGIGIAILDSGIKKREDLTDNIAYFQNFTGENQKIDDRFGHGTKVAGVISSKIHGIGIAPESKLFILKVINDDGQADNYAVVEGLKWILANHKLYNIRIVNMSFGFPNYGDYKDSPIFGCINKLHEEGVLLVSSVGNNGKSTNSITIPAIFPNVVSVGSVVRESHSLNKYVLSNFTSVDSLIPDKPDLYTIGENIKTTSNIGDDFIRVSGTSYSCAIVSGFGALLLQRKIGMSLGELENELYICFKKFKPGGER